MLKGAADSGELKGEGEGRGQQLEPPGNGEGGLGGKHRGLGCGEESISRNVPDLRRAFRPLSVVERENCPKPNKPPTETEPIKGSTGGFGGGPLRAESCSRKTLVPQPVSGSGSPVAGPDSVAPLQRNRGARGEQGGGKLIEPRVAGEPADTGAAKGLKPAFGGEMAVVSSSRDPLCVRGSI